ncbi:MAG: hypothetical protein HKL80_06640 [Acidimicrobiales bacterium]|nr:hypothetical protein [Acidimicrobiales bacterium]
MERKEQMQGEMIYVRSSWIVVNTLREGNELSLVDHLDGLMDNLVKATGTNPSIDLDIPTGKVNLYLSVKAKTLVEAIEKANNILETAIAESGGIVIDSSSQTRKPKQPSYVQTGLSASTKNFEHNLIAV